jgi:hypothetical protein
MFMDVEINICNVMYVVHISMLLEKWKSSYKSKGL